ncbi:MAG: hypothetical protein ACXACY_06900, partial [Candidatus Hodarchaeales archaeon]
FIALVSLIPGTEVGSVILFLATTFSLTFIFLMFEGLIPQLEKYIFSPEKKFDLRKFVFFFVNYLISLALILPYFLLSPDIDTDFLRWDIALPVVFIVIYFGWNLIQIFYLRIGFEDISVKTEDKLVNSLGPSKTKELVDVVMLVLALAIPALLQLGMFFGFLDAFVQSNEELGLVIFTTIMGIIIISTSWRLITLFHRSRKMNSSNSYMSMLYILIWLILTFRSFSYLNSMKNVSTQEVDILSSLIDIMLMVVTALLVLRSLGEKVYDSMLFNLNNLPFFLFSFTLLYIEGQIILITGAGSLTGFFGDRNQINLANNALIILVTLIFYWWYSEHSLEKKGYIVRKRFDHEDVVHVILDFKKFLEDNNALDSSKIGEPEIHGFLNLQKIQIPSKEPEEEHSEIEGEDS